MLHGMLKKAIYQPTKFEEMIVREKLRLAMLPPLNKKNFVQTFLRAAIGISAGVVLLLLVGCAGYYPNAGVGYRSYYVPRTINYGDNLPPVPDYRYRENSRPLGSFWNPVYTAPYFGVQ